MARLKPFPVPPKRKPIYSARKCEVVAWKGWYWIRTRDDECHGSCLTTPRRFITFDDSCVDIDGDGKLLKPQDRAVIGTVDELRPIGTYTLDEVDAVEEHNPGLFVGLSSEMKAIVERRKAQRALEAAENFSQQP